MINKKDYAKITKKGDSGNNYEFMTQKPSKNYTGNSQLKTQPFSKTAPVSNAPIGSADGLKAPDLTYQPGSGLALADTIDQPKELSFQPGSGLVEKTALEPSVAKMPQAATYDAGDYEIQTSHQDFQKVPLEDSVWEWNEPSVQEEFKELQNNNGENFETLSDAGPIYEINSNTVWMKDRSYPVAYDNNTSAGKSNNVVTLPKYVVPNLSIGSKGKAVVALQDALIRSGWWEKAAEAYKTETGKTLGTPGQNGLAYGTFGKDTEYVVNFYKDNNDLGNTEEGERGIVGNETKDKLGLSDYKFYEDPLSDIIVGDHHYSVNSAATKTEHPWDKIDMNIESRIWTMLQTAIAKFDYNINLAAILLDSVDPNGIDETKGFDFKQQLPKDTLFYIMGTVYNRFEMGNFIWAFACKVAGLTDQAILEGAQLESKANKRDDESWDQRAILHGITYYKIKSGAN